MYATIPSRRHYDSKATFGTANSRNRLLDQVDLFESGQPGGKTGSAGRKQLQVPKVGEDATCLQPDAVIYNLFQGGQLGRTELPPLF